MGFIQIDGIIFDIPQELDLSEALDEHSGTYRIVIGSVDPTEEQLSKYNPLFAAIDKHRSGLFIDNIIFGEDNQRLSMILATVDVYKKPFGTFYEIESSINDTSIHRATEGKKNDSNRRASITKSKTADKKRKTTRTGNGRISRT